MVTPREAALQPSPTFTNPPLVEVALGVEFQPIPDLTALPLARFAQTMEHRYPVVQEHPALPPNPPPGLSGDQDSGVFFNVGIPPLRMWLLGEDQDRLVQVQNDRLVLNWRGIFQNGPYPRYDDALRKDLGEVYTQFADFLEDHGLGGIKPVAVDVSYTNQIVQSTELIGLAWFLQSQDLGTQRYPEPSRIQLQQQWIRDLGHPSGPMTVTLSAHASDNGPTLINLQVRSAVAAAVGQDSVFTAMDVCHDELVEAFVKLTRTERQEEWGRTQ